MELCLLGKEGSGKAKVDPKALGTSVVEWEKVRSEAMDYCQRKKDQHRFDGQGNFDTRKVPTYDLIEQKEIIISHLQCRYLVTGGSLDAPRTTQGLYLSRQSARIMNVVSNKYKLRCGGGLNSSHKTDVWGLGGKRKLLLVL